MEKKKEEGLRFNQDKTRYDLVPAFAQEQYAKVLTKGAEKYAERNWEKGMKWSKVLASLERHLAAIKRGEDYDSETGLLHSAHIMCNAGFLTEYYKICPQGDDRPHYYLNNTKIGLDIDCVLADWIGGYKEYYKYLDNHEFDSWYLHFNIIGRCNNELNNEFYLNLKTLIDAKDIPFEPHCYITSRNIPSEITEEWLYKNGFPCRPVRTVGLSENKAEVAKEMSVEIFVDDVYKNFLELNKAGICTFLFDAPHNRRFDVGYKRLYNLKELL